MEYYPALSRNEVAVPDATRISLEDIVLDEIKGQMCGSTYWRYLGQANS